MGIELRIFAASFFLKSSIMGAHQGAPERLSETHDHPLMQA